MPLTIVFSTNSKIHKKKLPKHFLKWECQLLTMIWNTLSIEFIMTTLELLISTNLILTLIQILSIETGLHMSKI